jgi:hypothetical protein
MIFGIGHVFDKNGVIPVICEKDAVLSHFCAVSAK